MKGLTALAGASLLILAGCGTKPAEAPKADTATPTATVPAGTNWVETFSKTADGGMLMGNPNAPVKLIEYGALTCSHCAEFSETGMEGIKALVAKGTVSYEFRNFLLNILDVPAALLARCNGPGPFFAISERMFTTQREWLGKTASITPAEQKGWEGLAPEQLAPILAQRLGLDTMVQALGVGAEKGKACLSDKAAIAELESIQKVATDQFKVAGTPTFVINGSVATGVGTWAALEPELKKAGG